MSAPHHQTVRVVLESELFNAQIPIQTVNTSKRSHFPFRIDQISTQV